MLNLQPNPTSSCVRASQFEAGEHIHEAGTAAGGGRLLVTISLALGACGEGSSGVSAPTSPGKVGAAGITGPVHGPALVRALREGGLLLWMRHTERDERSGTVTPE
jgi:hypothetical protein